MTEGQKMFGNLLAIFFLYGLFFMLFEDIDRNKFEPLHDLIDWQLLLFFVITLFLVAVVLHRYSKRMDERISREQAKKEHQMRRELTQNISHELKTPVASIQGYLELMLHNPDIKPAQQQQFLEKSLAQTHRLTALLHDLSTLNRMDYATQCLEREEVDIIEIVHEVDTNTFLARQQQQQTFITNLPETLYVRGNRELLFSVFQNLLDNSIKYAGKNTTICLSATKEKKYWKFVFSDNGVGILPEHRNRVFERFYRIDKGRSRNLGGTGLGLSIVKNAVKLHGGQIKIQDVPNGGVAFAFTIAE